MATYTIKSCLGTDLYLNVGQIPKQTNVSLQTKIITLNCQWSISALRHNVKMYVSNMDYALNASDTWSCDVIASAGSAVNFIPYGKYYKIQLASDTTRYLTAGGSSSGANVSWTTTSTGNSVYWDVQEASFPTGKKILTMPKGPRCNWNQKNIAVTQYFGTGACTLVCGLDVSNFYATDGVGYVPKDMHSTTFWKPGYTWATLAGQILSVKKDETQEQFLTIIKETIDKGYPCIVTIGYSANLSHTVVAYGYEHGGETYKDISVYDPANSDASDIAGRAVNLYDAMDYNHDYFNIFSVRPTKK